MTENDPKEPNLLRSIGRMGTFKIHDSHRNISVMSVENGAVQIAASDLAKQLQLDGFTIDDNLRSILESHVRGHITKLIANADGKGSLDKGELAKEALGLSSVTNLKLHARKLVLQKKAEMLTCRRRWYIIIPSDTRKICWDILNVILLIFSIFEIPFSLAFMSSNKSCSITVLDNVNLAVDCCFCVDCLLNFITAYIDSETGIVVVDLSKIVNR